MTVLFPFGGLSRFCTSPAGGSIAGRSRKLSGSDMMPAIDFEVRLMLLLRSFVMRNGDVRDKRWKDISHEVHCVDRTEEESTELSWHFTSTGRIAGRGGVSILASRCGKICTTST